MATHSSILVWRMPWTEEPGGLQSRESHRVGHDWSGYTHTHTHTHTFLFSAGIHIFTCLSKNISVLFGAFACVTSFLYNDLPLLFSVVKVSTFPNIFSNQAFFRNILIYSHWIDLIINNWNINEADTHCMFNLESFLLILSKTIKSLGCVRHCIRPWE